MKKFMNVISWVSFISILWVVGVGSMMAGVYTANYFADATGYHGLAWAPVVIVVAVMADLFILSGLKRFGNESN